ncbi:MAG TPA: glycosyltransferase [Dehalococcoidia bacterium]|nr:glycosyltransferase [Dehalococcoidia bacterium]
MDAAPARSSLLVLSFSDLARDPRVHRQIRLLRDGYRVTAAGYADPCVPDVEFIPIPPVRRTALGKIAAAAMLKCRLFERFYWSSAAVVGALRRLEGRSFDLVLANDVNTLPLALSLRPRRGVVFDAHEYAPRELEESWRWRFLFQAYIRYLCRRYIGRAAAMTTVCEGIADEYARNYGMGPAVVHNAPYLQPLSPLGALEGRIRLVHHGAAIRSRNIERMIEMMRELDERFSLDFYLVPTDPDYLERLRRAARNDPRIRFLPAVPMQELPRILNTYDVGVYILEPNNFNNQHALPNKLFEFIQGRVAVAIGPSPEMARIVRRYDCGVVAGDFSPSALAEELRRLTPERIDHYKRRSDAAARELCYENASQTLLGVLSAVARTEG